MNFILSGDGPANGSGYNEKEKVMETAEEKWAGYVSKIYPREIEAGYLYNNLLRGF